MAELNCEVLVAGGGLIGATAALALSRRGLNVVLVDRGEPPVTRGTLGFDVRTVALNPASVELLTRTRRVARVYAVSVRIASTPAKNAARATSNFVQPRWTAMSSAGSSRSARRLRRCGLRSSARAT